MTYTSKHSFLNFFWGVRSIPSSFDCSHVSFSSLVIVALAATSSTPEFAYSVYDHFLTFKHPSCCASGYVCPYFAVTCLLCH